MNYLLKRICWIPIAALIACGCHTTRAVERLDASDIERIQMRSDRERAEVTLHSFSKHHRGQAYAALSLRIGSDSTTWIDPRSLDLIHVASSDVASVSFVDRAQWAAWFGTLGAISGATMGALLVEDDPPQSSSGSFGLGIGVQYPMKLIAGIGVGALGGLIGAISGYAIGKRETYVLQPYATFFDSLTTKPTK